MAPVVISVFSFFFKISFGAFLPLFREDRKEGKKGVKMRHAEKDARLRTRTGDAEVSTMALYVIHAWSARPPGLSFLCSDRKKRILVKSGRGNTKITVHFTHSIVIA